MVISEKILNIYFNFNTPFEQILPALMQLGFFSYRKANTFCPAISVEIPTTRPDCNSFYGLVRELKSLMPSLKLPQINISNWTMRNMHNFEYSAVTISYDAITVSDIMIDALKNNGLFTGNKITDFSNFQTLMYGNPVIFFNYVDKFTVKVLKEDTKINDFFYLKGTPVIIVNEKYLPWLPLKNGLIDNSISEGNITFLTIYFSSEYIKKVIDRYSSIDFNKYYYFIKNSNSEDSLRSVMSIQNGTKCHFFKESNRECQIALSYENIKDVLGIAPNWEFVKRCLKSFGYKINLNGVVIPYYRNDVKSEEHVAFDIMRICFSELSKLNTVEEKYIKIPVEQVNEIMIGLSFDSYCEIISYPFISKKNVDFYSSYNTNMYLPIKILNNQRNDKIYCLFTFQIGIINNLNNKYNKLFERGNIKYINKEGKYETREVICIGEKCGDDITNFFKVISQIKLYIKKEIMIFPYHKKNNYTWKINSGKEWVGDIAYIIDNKTIVLLFEFVTDIIENKPVKIISGNIKNMTRNISLDINISISYMEVLKKINDCDTDNILDDVKLEKASVIRKSDIIVINYVLKMIYCNTTKDSIKTFNKKIYNELHNYCGFTKNRKETKILSKRIDN